VGRNTLWEVTLSSPVEIQHHFGGMYFHTPECLKQARHQQKTVLLDHMAIHPRRQHYVPLELQHFQYIQLNANLTVFTLS
jgi:hypothetical protein